MISATGFIGGADGRLLLFGEINHGRRSRAKRVQKPWQAMEQNQTEGRGLLRAHRVEPAKTTRPVAGRRHRASPRGCQSRMRGRG